MSLATPVVTVTNRSVAFALVTTVFGRSTSAKEHL